MSGAFRNNYGAQQIWLASNVVQNANDQINIIPDGNRRKLFNADNTFRSRDELAAIFTGRNAAAGKRVVAYCGGGIAATGDAFALTALLGHDDVTVYDNSLQEWAADPSLPMSVG